MAFLSVVVIGLCPTTVSKVAGRYLRAETMKFSMQVSKNKAFDSAAIRVMRLQAVSFSTMGKMVVDKFVY